MIPNTVHTLFTLDDEGVMVYISLGGVLILFISFLLPCVLNIFNISVP